MRAITAISMRARALLGQPLAGEASCSTSVSRRDTLLSALVAAAALSVPASPAFALPAECLNGVMEERQRLGLDPFAPPCDDPDPGPLPIYPILAAKTTVDGLLAEETLFKTLVRTGQPTGNLQVPPVINMGLFGALVTYV